MAYSIQQTMGFELSLEQIELRDALRNYLNSEVAPIVDEYEAKHQMVPKNIIEKMYEFGLLGGMFDESKGGFNLSAVTYGMLIAEVARVWPSLRSIVSTSNLAASVLVEGGSQYLIDQYLPQILSAQSIASFALSEPNVGSDAANIETRATETDDGWLVNGRKLYISLGPVCDLIVAFVRTGTTGTAKDVSCLIIERDTPGLSVQNIPKMGMHSCPLGELLFDDVLVPKQNLIGTAGQGFQLAKKYLNFGRSVVSFSALGVAQAAFEAATRYATERIQFDQPIAKFQLVQQMIADMASMVEIARLLSYRSADAIDRQAKDSQLLCSMAKRYSTEAVLRVAELSMQVHGGAGYTTLFPIERYYRDARHLAIAEGTNQIQTLLIAQQILGVSALR